MNIGTVSSAISSQSLQRQPEAAEVKGRPENDGDADDGTKSVRKTPTVNTSGQSVGNLINETA